MLSTENPPPDLCEISQLKRGSSDERASDSNEPQREVDLFKSGLDSNNPLTKFSIRDYVFSTRGKDIKNNWPFSQKNLQVCLKHGAKDVLPPFQSLDSVRNHPSIEARVVDSLRHSDVKYPELSDGSVPESPALNIENTNLSECEEDRELPSTTTSQSCSDKNSVRPVRKSRLEPEAPYLRVSSSEKSEFAVRECKKAESNTQSPAKKCRLILKINNISEPKSEEDSAANAPVVSETMASKVCPVCKTFSSSSNTTLNAHIDQCLSGESVKWTTNAKVIKHRIKPRKTRLMVDIYETALHSTLEDLDRRNGTNWASNMGLHSQDLEACAGVGKKAYSPVNIEDINQEGAVYIDSSGTKLRILSKLSHPPSTLKNNDVQPFKFVKREKVIKILSSKKKKKKKHTVQKLELKKNSLDGQGSCSPIPDLLPDYPLRGPISCYSRFEVNDDQEMLYPSEGCKENDLTKSDDHMRSDFGMIKQWVGSKRTGLKKKISLDLENQLPDKSLKKLRIKSVSSLSDRGNSGPISPASSDEDPVLPPEGLKRKENLSRSRDGWTQLPYPRKEPGFSLLRSERLSKKKNHLMASKFNAKHSRKESTTVHEHLMDPSNNTENHASPRCNKKMGISNGHAVKNDKCFIGSSISYHCTFSPEDKNATPLKKLSLGHAISSGGRKFSSLRSKLLSVRHASGAESKKNLRGELSNFKNPRLRSRLRSDEEAAVSQSAFHAEKDNMVKLLGEDAALMEKDSDEPSTNRTKVLKIRKKIGGFVNTGEGYTTSKGSERSTESDSYDAGNNIDSFTGGSVPGDTVLEEEAEMPDDFVCEPASTDGEGFASFSKSLDSSFPGLSISNVERVSQYYSKEYDGHCPTELVFHSDQEMFCADSVSKNLVTPDSHEMDGDEAQGNYFIDVDPIPIPGPPGSFLPSPGRMGSEELLGHSSLTTCRIQSSDDGHEVVDMDSSDSPVSAMSTVSNSVARRSSSISTANLSAQSHFQHESQIDITKGRINPMVEASPPFEQIASGERELNLIKSKANSMLSKVTHEVQNIQPCCCSRKDASLKGGSLHYQESQILRRRTMTSLSVLAPEKQMNDDLDNEIRCYDLGAAGKEPTPVSRKDLTNLPNGYTRVPVPHNSEAVFGACDDCEFPTPNPVPHNSEAVFRACDDCEFPTPNPVLRLMGKNLMVVNKDDNLSLHARPTQSSVMIDHPDARLCVENGLSIRSNPNEPNSFHHMISRGSSMFDDMHTRIPAQQFDFSSSDAFMAPANYRPSSQLPSHPSTAMISSMSFGDNAVHHLKTRDASAGKHKEIIIIDGSPESEAVKATHCSTNMEARESGGTAASMLLPPDLRHVNPFYSYEARINPRFTGSPVVANRNTIVPPENLGKWNCIPEGSSAVHSNSSSGSLPSSVHLRSMYFAPGFS